VDFRILGPIEVWSPERRHDIGWAKERLVLAALLLTPGEPVSADSLISRIWDDNPPPKARGLLYSQVSRLKKRLNAIGEGVDLWCRSGAYVLETDQENIDYHRFQRLRAQARAIAESGDEDQAVQLLRDAAGLWRGEPLAGLPGSWATRIRQGLEHDLRVTIVERAELELRLGRHADLIAELSALTDRFPLDEKLTELLMMALYRSGQQADALAVFRQARQRLVDQLAAEAGPALQELHQRILRGDPSLHPFHRPASGRDSTPRDLPRDTSTFTGRARELDWLTSASARRGTAITVLAIHGMPGVGKTTLAVHLAHQLIDQYPDGQLYLKLHGYDTKQKSVDPATALDRLLGRIGVPDLKIPNGLEDRATLWRTKLSRRRMLIVLDDATGHEQINHLLPGTPGCLVVITSRRRLTGLDDVRPLQLDVLPPDDAVTLFGQITGPRSPLEADDVASVVRLCGYLPLAIQLVGSKALHHPTWDVGDLVARLGEEDRRLAEIRAGDRAITGVFDLSYHGLGKRQQWAFRSLSLHLGTDFTLDCTAALLLESPAAADILLEDLLNHHLVTEPQRGRYRFHDLIRSYARQLCAEDPETERREITHRILDFYLFTADRADHLLYPGRPRIVAWVTRPPLAYPVLNTADEARKWLTTEFDNLVQVIRHAISDRWPRHAAMFPHVLSAFLETEGLWEEAAGLHEGAVAAWREMGEQAGIARALTDLALVRWRAGKLDEALQQAREALIIQRAIHNQHGIADALDQIGLIYWHLSDFDTALGYCEQALQIRRSVRDRRGEATTLDHLGILNFHRGNYIEAADQMHQALTVYQKIGDRYGQQMTLNNIGDLELRLGNDTTALHHYEESAVIAPEMKRQHRAIWLSNVASVHQHTHRYSEALDLYRTALATYQEIGDRRNESIILDNIGCCYARMGRDDEALIHHEKALQLCLEIADRYVECQARRNIGDVHQRAGRHETALGHYRQSLELTRAIGDLYFEARSLEQMGASILHTRGRSHAEDHWRQALTLYERLGVPEAETLRPRLDPSGP
jgi:DNA-binding SARP family transcriptional activator/Tfp pilus assembly protein PilF